MEGTVQSHMAMRRAMTRFNNEIDTGPEDLDGSQSSGARKEGGLLEQNPPSNKTPLYSFTARTASVLFWNVTSHVFGFLTTFLRGPVASKRSYQDIAAMQ
jgi:hypothetical protein